MLNTKPLGFICIVCSLAPSISATADKRSENQAGHQKINIEQYRLWEAHDIQERITRWRDEYPNLINVETAQGSFGLPRAGTAQDCPQDEGVNGCTNYFFTIQDFIAHPQGSESSASLPEVFWSGSLHGDERLGPTVVIEAAALLLEAATCEARPNRTAKDFEKEINEARLCRAKLQERGINDEHRRWLSRLLSTRRIVVVPTANALGFYRNEHGENDVDPEEDFAYGKEKPNSCMRTIAARTVNEIFRKHIFQLGLSFHNGEGGVGYSWGSPTWLEHLSPDKRSQHQVAEAYSNVAGGVSYYRYGQLNDEMQYREGSIEDWAYAGSWDTARVRSCDPESFGGYGVEKTTYNNSTNRAVTMLISANTKTSQSDIGLGSSLNLFERDRDMDELHVARNMRLAFVSADLVQPYVSIFGVDDLALSDDIVPMTERTGRSCQRTKAIAIPFGQDKMIVEWTVGGGIHISQTELWYSPWDEISETQVDCMSQPKNMNGFSRARSLGTKDGSALFSSDGPQPHPNESFIKPGKALGPVFRAEIDTTGFKVGDEIVLLASARVDQHWEKGPKGNFEFEPKTAPQSHLANARTNPDWSHENEGKKVQGRLDWFSVPVTVVVNDFDYRIGSLELYDRFGPELHFGTGVGSLQPKTKSATDFFWLFLSGVSAFMMILFCTIRVLKLRGENAKMESVLAAEMNAMQKNAGFFEKSLFFESSEDSVYASEIDANTEIIDFQA